MTLGTPFHKATQSKTEIRDSYDAMLEAFECGYRSATRDELAALRDDVLAKGQALLDSGFFPEDAMEEVREDMGFAASIVVAMTAHHDICTLQEQIDTAAPEKISALEAEMETVRVTAEAQLQKIMPPSLQ
ncbi:MAG: hypothetical protein JWO78_1033 [Micavibrio sp.]|nr:hypothetical protein [Micavibrio sp.]